MGKFSTKGRFGGNGSPKVPEGAYTATIAILADIGNQETSFGRKDQVKVGFVLDQDGEDGKPLELSRTYTWSLHEKASLRDLAVRALGKEAAANLQDLEELLGKSVDLEVVHEARKDGDGTYAKVDGVFRARGKGPDLRDWKPGEFWENLQAEGAVLVTIHDKDQEPKDEEPAAPAAESPTKGKEAKGAPAPAPKEEEAPKRRGRPASRRQEEEDEE